MKTKIVIISLFLSIAYCGQAQKLNETVKLDRYASANKEWKENGAKKISVVFLGNSITQGWVNKRPDFFTSNNYVGRGIGGQTSPQLLLRFRPDVINLHPKIVVINVGTNDIAENTGAYNPEFTLGNIISMVELARANDIKVILSSVLPAGGFKWNQNIKDAPQKIDALNAAIKKYARQNKLEYIDYNTSMRNSDGSMISTLSNDGVHPLPDGYIIMESLAKKAISATEKRK